MSEMARAKTLSLGERVSPEATGEGVRRRRLSFALPRSRFADRLSAEHPHPAAPQPPSP